MGWFSRKKKEEKPEAKSDDPNMQQVVTDLSLERMINLKICEEHGFKPSSSLPTIKEVKLRPAEEISGRLHAIKALVLWLMVPEERLPSERILNFIKTNELEAFITTDESEILKSRRDDEVQRNNIGWKFENAWPLAWYFGYEQPEISGRMMTGEEMQTILTQHTCLLDGDHLEWIGQQKTQDEQQVIMIEDLFYCIHNAVRSAQLGHQTVPDGFHPVGNGGVIHERRHALTWMLSESVSWEDTDLST